MTRPKLHEQKEGDVYDKMGDAILFETEENAQSILDDKFPGHTVTLADGDNHYAVVTNQKDEIVLRMSW